MPQDSGRIPRYHAPRAQGLRRLRLARNGIAASGAAALAAAAAAGRQRIDIDLGDNLVCVELAPTENWWSISSLSFLIPSLTTAGVTPQVGDDGAAAIAEALATAAASSDSTGGNGASGADAEAGRGGLDEGRGREGDGLVGSGGVESGGECGGGGGGVELILRLARNGRLAPSARHQRWLVSQQTL